MASGTGNKKLILLAEMKIRKWGALYLTGPSLLDLGVATVG
jgi:hypothetical protein